MCSEAVSHLVSNQNRRQINEVPSSSIDELKRKKFACLLAQKKECTYREF